MGVYAITGGSRGLGAETVRYLCAAGHDVLNVDLWGGEICVDLGTDEGRQKAIAQLHRRCPRGLDGLICNAGILIADTLSYILSVNYFGAITVAEGVYDLLKLKKGRCVVTISGLTAGLQHSHYNVTGLLNSCGDEDCIGRLVDTFELHEAAGAICGSSYAALAHWVRRIAYSWAAEGVSVNAVVPDPAATPAETAAVLAFIAQPAAGSCSGAMLCRDGGAPA